MVYMVGLKSLANVFFCQLKIVFNCYIYSCKIVYSIIYLLSYKLIYKLFYSHSCFQIYIKMFA